MASSLQEVNRKLVENLQSDLRALSSETKRKHPHVKEAAENGLLRIRSVSAKKDSIIAGLLEASVDVVRPFIAGCDTRIPKLVVLCLTAIQRLVQHQAIATPAAELVMQTLWKLMETGTEELRLLQTSSLMVTRNSVIQGDSLSKAIVLCFRLHFSKDTTTSNTAAATVRQLVSAMFERVVVEDGVLPQESRTVFDGEALKNLGMSAPSSLRPAACDAFMLFQDLCQLVNAERPIWLIGMVEMTRSFGLDLLEAILSGFPQVFQKHPEFSFLLKERVCPLIIKLFSPSLKFRVGAVPASPTSADKPYFPIVMRLLRVISILIKFYFSLLVTECEIFLSLLIKFLESEKSNWQRCLALEVLVQIVSQPYLIRSICVSYDMKTHSTKIFQEIVNGLASFIQSSFVGGSSSASISSAKADSMSMIQGSNAGVPNSNAAFEYRGVYYPIVLNPSTVPKPLHLEMLEKTETPAMPDGYGISLAFVSMLNLIRSMTNSADEKIEEILHKELIESSWCGTLSALSLLFEACLDESSCEGILKALQSLISTSGHLDLKTSRDAFITALCKWSLPPRYSVLSVNEPVAVDQQLKLEAQLDRPTSSQVVAVGTALATVNQSMNNLQGPVMLTAKNIHCMRALLNVAHCHGAILSTAWHLVLTTLQHLAWILGLKPSLGGSLKASDHSADGNAVITTAAMADLPVLSSMLSRLFESSQFLDDVSLHHLIDALCKLSTEAMEIAYSNREPSLFAVAKLLETGLVNLSRVEVLWKPLTAHLLEVSCHAHTSMRLWAAEAISCLVRSAMSQNPPLDECHHTMLLSPLQRLPPAPDVRQKQLDCVLAVLRSSGDRLGLAWPVLLGVIGALDAQHTAPLVRHAFQCLQLVISDFLPVLPTQHLQSCIEVVAKFALQQEDLNVSLTAIGLIWNMADFCSQHHSQLTLPDAPGQPSSFGDATSADDGTLVTSNEKYVETVGEPDSVWMCLYARLGQLCVDCRPAVRKSAGQTLFSTISAHSRLLQHKSWHKLLWSVLFPLLEKVKLESHSASTTATGTNILMHHSRDTAEKQWAETRVLSLAGVARLFNTSRPVLQLLSDFPRAWTLLLEFIEDGALSGNAEVSLASLRSLQQVLQLSSAEEWRALFSGPAPLSAPAEENISRVPVALTKRPAAPNVAQEQPRVAPTVATRPLWWAAWKVWLRIGQSVTQRKTSLKTPSSQSFLTALVETFPAMHSHIGCELSAADLVRLGQVLLAALATPDDSNCIVGDGELSALECATLEAADTLINELSRGADPISADLCECSFRQLLALGDLVLQPNASAHRVLFGERVLGRVTDCYVKMATHPAVLEKQLLHVILEHLRKPLKLKYDCPAQSTWKLAISCLLKALNAALPVARSHRENFTQVWPVFGCTLEDFLFSDSLPPESQSVDECQKDEAIDCKVVELIGKEVLSDSQNLPESLITQLMNVLKKGSVISSSSDSFLDLDSTRLLREDLAQTCFQTLLEYSLRAGDVRNLAVSSMLDQCQTVIHKFTSDQRLSGKMPLPRARMSEIAFVLKAIATLLSTLKASSSELAVWDQIIKLYPSLVECTDASSPQVRKSLQLALLGFYDLLKPPALKSFNGI